MRVLITGASGFIGRAILSKLQKERHEILALSREAMLKPVGEFNCEAANLSDLSSYKKIVIAFKPQIVLHLAWQGIPDFSFDMSILNLRSSLEFLNLVIQQESCKKIIVAGSCFELHKLNGECKEKENPVSKDHFTWAKNAIRNWLFMRTAEEGRINACWMRIFYVYGPFQRSGSLIPTLLNYFSKNQLPPIKTINNANDFIYIDDVAEGFIKAIEKKSAKGTFHLGSGSSTTVLELCQIAEQLVLGSNNFSKKLIKLSTDDSLSVNFWSNNSRSRKELCWTPNTSIRSGISKTWQWMSQT